MVIFKRRLAILILQMKKLRKKNGKVICPHSSRSSLAEIKPMLV